MIIHTKAIVLRAIKFKDSSLIVKCYTEQGVKSYIIKGILGRKKAKIKAAFFQTLNLLDIVANHNDKGSLNTLKEVRLSYAYTTIPSDIVKQSLVMFLSEVLNFSLQEEEANPELFNFLFNSFQFLDTQEKAPNFHLLFLINLTKYLGFYPYRQYFDFNYFNLQEGVFQNKPSPTAITGKNLTLFKALLGTDFDTMDNLKLNKEQRQNLLEILINYFELHLSGFRKLNSIPILKSVFS